MDMEERVVGEVLVVRPVGKRIDASGSADFKGKMVDRINRGRNLIVLDLSDVDFIDGSGLGAIVSMLKTLGKKGELRIGGLKETVDSLFRLTRMDRVFRIHPSAEEAVLALAAAKSMAKAPA